MWKLEALRHALGDQSIRVTSGFRSTVCNSAVGGASNSRHLYGDAADLGAGPHALCTLAKEARNHGFNGILGPGYPEPRRPRPREPGPQPLLVGVQLRYLTPHMEGPRAPAIR